MTLALLVFYALAIIAAYAAGGPLWLLILSVLSWFAFAGMVDLRDRGPA